MILAGDTPIFIHRRTETGVDGYGNPTYSTEEILVRNCLLGWGGTSEPIDPARNPVDAALTVYFPHGTEILDGDVFEIRNSLWEKNGDAISYETVNGFEAGVVVSVRRRSG